MGQDATRRNFLIGGALATGGVASAQPGSKGGDDPAEFPRTHPGRGGPVGSQTDRGRLVAGYRKPGLEPVPVHMPDVPTLDWKMVGGVKEFRLTIEPVRREFLPGMSFWTWSFNGSNPGPLIEAVAGDRVRFVVKNALPEPTTVHWHGLELPIKFDGEPGLSQDPIPPGGTFVYEYDLHQDGTFFYHSHGAMQEIMGASGLFVIHPKAAYDPAVDRDFGLVFHEWAVLPQSDIPNSLAQDFNFMTVNGRSGPYTTPLVCKLGERVRVRLMNLSPMNHHPIHLHGHTFWTTGTEAGRIPEGAWVPGNTVLVGVGQSRDVEFVANNPGDWLLHCHILHHMMNHMVTMVRMPDLRGQMTHGSRPPTDIGPAVGQPNGGAALAPDSGPGLGAGTGAGTTSDRRVLTGPPVGEKGSDPRFQVPGFPQDMMDMKLMQTAMMADKLNKPETAGMRKNWFLGPHGMMTVLRVLPAELFDRVTTGEGDIPSGASAPDAGPGMLPAMKGK
ncbi:MAG: copper oxidase [Gemmataceae bacterium]